MIKNIPYHRPVELELDDIDKIYNEMDECFSSGMISNAHNCRLLETEIASMYGAKYAIATNNCTNGLRLCFEYFRMMYNDIHMPVFTWLSVYIAAANLFRKITFGDIDPDTWLMNDYPKDKLICANHCFGNIADLDSSHVIYDGAHALGSVIKNIGLATVFSLAPTKLITGGEGGVIITNDPSLADFCKQRRDTMCRLPEFNAILATVNLSHLSEITLWKKEVFEYYSKNLPGIFQKVDLDSSYATIGFINSEKLEVPEHIAYKQYYKPVRHLWTMKHSKYVYDNIICLPSYFGVDYKKIVEDILHVNGY